MEFVEQCFCCVQRDALPIACGEHSVSAVIMQQLSRLERNQYPETVFCEALQKALLQHVNAELANHRRAANLLVAAACCSRQLAAGASRRDSSKWEVKHLGVCDRHNFASPAFVEDFVLSREPVEPCTQTLAVSLVQAVSPMTPPYENRLVSISGGATRTPTQNTVSQPDARAMPPLEAYVFAAPNCARDIHVAELQSRLEKLEKQLGANEQRIEDVEDHIVETKEESSAGRAPDVPENVASKCRAPRVLPREADEPVRFERKCSRFKCVIECCKREKESDHHFTCGDTFCAYMLATTLRAHMRSSDVKGALDEAGKCRACRRPIHAMGVRVTCGEKACQRAAEYLRHKIKRNTNKR
jgi:hypothetical protein